MQGEDIYHICGHSDATGNTQNVERKEEHTGENYSFFNDITHRFHSAWKLFKDGSISQEWQCTISLLPPAQQDESQHSQKPRLILSFWNNLYAIYHKRKTTN